MPSEDPLHCLQVFENTSDSIFIFDVTAERRFRLHALNPAAERMTQRARETVVGKYLEDMASSDAVIQQVLPRYRECIDSAQRVWFQGHYDVLAGRLYLENELIPVRDATGRIYRLVAVARDITARLKIQRALEYSETRHRKFFENSWDSIFIFEITPEHRFRLQDINPAAERSLGWMNEQVQGKYLEELISNRTFEQVVPAYRCCIESGEVVHYEIDAAPPAGPRYFSCAVIPLRDDSGGISRLMVVARDVSRGREAETVQQKRREELEARVAERTVELRQRTQQLEREIRQRQRTEAMLAQRSEELARTNTELEAFSYSLSHDLRAPLRTIDGFAKLLFESYAARLDETARGYLSRISSGAQRMNLLIGDMLKLFRMSRREMHVTRIDLSELAREVLSDLGRTQPKANVTIALEPNMQVDADASLLRVAVENILSNAWKFTRGTPAPQIELGCTKSASGTTYFVRDNGAGFDMSKAQEAFAPFARLHSEVEFEGTGIGLAIVQRVFDRHGGRVWLESRPGQGTTVYFRFGR